MLGRHLGLFSDRIEHDLAPEFRADLRAILKRAAERNFQTEPKADMTKLSDAELETLTKDGVLK